MPRYQTSPTDPNYKNSEIVARLARRIEKLEQQGQSGFSERRNLVDNGGFRIHQRGPGTVSLGTGAAYYTADRWFTNNNGAGVWDQAVVDVVTPKGLRRALRMICTTADAALAVDDFLIINQGIEGYVIAPSMLSTTSLPAMSLSFDAYTNVAGTYIYEFFQWSSTGTLTRGLSRAFVMPANAWTSVVISIPPDTSANMAFDNKVAMSMQLFLAAGSDYQGGTLDSTWDWPVPASTRAAGQTNLASAVNNNFHITEIQLEVGSPTSFELLSYDDDFRRCRRYFQRWQQPPLRGVVSTGTGTARLGMALPVTMRAIPTIDWAGTINVYDGVDGRTLSGASASNYSLSGDVVEFDATVTVAWTVSGRAVMLYQNAGGGYFDFRAEI